MEFNLFGATLSAESTHTVESRKAEYDQLQKDFNFLVDNSMKADQSTEWSPMAERPLLSEPLLATDTGAKVPVLPFPLSFVFRMVKNIDALRLPVDTLNREYHRNGFEIIPMYHYKCMNCEKEFQGKPTFGTRFIGETGAKEQKLKCDVCGSNKFTSPDPKQRTILVRLLKQFINHNRQKFVHLSKQIARDLDIADFAVVLLIKKYKKGDGELIESEISEVLRVNPAQVLIIADYEGRIGYDEKGKQIFFCPYHRVGNRVYRETDNNGNEIPTKDFPKCPDCGLRCLPAAIEVNSLYQNTAIGDQKKVIYGDNEVIMVHGKSWVDTMYGFSHVYTLWSKAMALSHMDEFVRKYFDKMRPPRGLLVIGSRNYTSLQKSFDDMKQKMAQDPYSINPLMVESERGARNMVEYVNLTGSLEDLQFVSVREEFRRTIAATYGVSNVFEGNSQGLSQSNMEMMVTNRAIEAGQECLREDVYEPICKAFGVSDWVIKLKTGEETDELRDLQTEGQAITNANGMFGMGFGVELDADNKFIYTQKPVEEIGSENMPAKSPAPKGEELTQYSGEARKPRPSDAGGTGAGSPASGDHTSTSQKGRKN